MTSLTPPTFGYHLIIGFVLPYLDTGRGKVFVFGFPYMLRFFVACWRLYLAFRSLEFLLVRQYQDNPKLINRQGIIQSL